jgi:hypothetical protein
MPRSGIPIFTWSPKAGDSYTVVHKPSGTEITVPVEFVYNGASNSTAVWTVGQIVQMLNNALGVAHAKLLALDTGVGYAIPRIDFDTRSGLFAHNIPHVYDGRVELFTRYSVARLFANMGGNNPLATGYLASVKEFQITNQGCNAAGIFDVLTQEFPSLYAWSDLLRIELDTNVGTVVLTDLATPDPTRISREPLVYGASSPRWQVRPENATEPIKVAGARYVTRTGSWDFGLNAGETFRAVIAERSASA